MCLNPQKTASDTMIAIEPTLKAFLSYENILNTPNGQAAIAAYDKAEVDVANWVKGAPATEVLEVVGDFTDAFAAVVAPLDLPPQIELLVTIILAGIQGVIGILTGNSPAPIVAGVAATPETQRAWEAHVVAETTAKVQVMLPDLKPSIWRSLLPGHSLADQYTAYWRKTVKANNLPESLMV